MGSLCPPFILCPLSDRKELLGMSEDKLLNKVIITIGRNIAIRYHILEQKQETSWTISRHWLTSRVVYCGQVQKYGAIVDNTTIALWDQTDTLLNKFKKHKFRDGVLELRPTLNLGTLVIFENGFVTSLKRATENRNIDMATSKGIIETEVEIILDLQVNEEKAKVILLIGQKIGDKKLHRHIQKRDKLKVIIIKLSSISEDSETFEIEDQFNICQENQEIVGHCILPTQPTSLLYLCSDGKLYQEVLVPKMSTTKTVLGFLGNNVSPKTPVVIKVIEDLSTLIIYGSDPSEEGAVVFLYDLKYDLVVAKQSLKLYGTPPIMERIGTSIIVPVGMHILVLNFRASKSLLSSVVGKHQIRSGEEVFEQRSPWREIGGEWEVDKDAVNKGILMKRKKKMESDKKREMEIIKETFPDCWEIVQQFKILEREGQPESSICNQVIPLALEQNNMSALDWILDRFTDIPEIYLVRILSYLLTKLPEPVPRILEKKNLNISSGIPIYNGSPIKAQAEVGAMEMEELVYSPNLRMNALIRRSFDKNELIRNLPSLNYEMVRQLIGYLKSMMDQFWPSGAEECDGGNMECDDAGCWMKWISVLLDAHYPKFVLNNEIGLIEELLGVVEERSKVMEAIEDLEPYLLLTYNKVRFEPRPNPGTKWRSEIVTFH